jgi:hypothetical protein
MLNVYLDVIEQTYDEDSKNFKNKELNHFFVFSKLLFGG